MVSKETARQKFLKQLREDMFLRLGKSTYRPAEAKQTCYLPLLPTKTDTMDSNDNIFLFGLVFIGAFALGIYITRAIYEIPRRVDLQNLQIKATIAQLKMNGASHSEVEQLVNDYNRINDYKPHSQKALKP